jgi:hypothetical protein
LEKEGSEKMRPATNSTAATVDTGFRNWKTPIPYLFAGLAIMLGLITVALVILVCSYRKSSSHSPGDAEEKPAKPVPVTEADSEPKIVVIMAGEDNPTYLAKPVSAALHTEQV